MKDYKSYLILVLICTGIAMALYPDTARAEKCEKWVAKAVSVQGTVEAKGEGETQWVPVKLNDTYCPGDVIRVKERSRADIALVNHPVLRLDENSTMVFGGLKDERTSLVNLVDGAVHFFSRVVRNLEVQTAFVNAGVEGTEGVIRVEKEKTTILIFEGKVLASNEAGHLTLTSGQSAEAEAGKAPVPTIVVRPLDAVHWALYYPPIIYYRPTDFQGSPMIRDSIEAYRKGDLSGAFSKIGGVPEDTRDPRFFTYRASLLLTVGRVKEAGADIERALSLEPENSDAFALQSIVAVAQNEKEKALGFAQKAVEKDPNSATAKVALSYAQQASFDLSGALASLKDAVKLAPENALAWVRLAELQLSFGKRGDALEAAEKAVALNPDLSRTQTILGFAYLSQVKTKESKGAFEKAIELDQADPLPRLGLGLSKIREGNLQDGRREIEFAMSLDPDNALIRSYLGKAYFEEKRDKLATEQYSMAKDLDPLDPTSFFYDAIQKQTENRPGEALQDLQKAIELNDNRAIYRSRLLLDGDLAARSASLARIYSDLGFQELALVEGWKSVNTDPSNYSAHRFLADSYAALPRNEIARVSELLQSQLLQPLNITPIQPRLAESNLLLIGAGGPASLSFNEFNPLFNRDRIALQASGIMGENKTYGEEIVVSGIEKKVSFSLGQTHYTTNGWRENSDQNDSIQNAFLQYEASDKTNLQVEFRHRDLDTGDLALRFFPDQFLPGSTDLTKSSTYRLGVHQGISSGSDLLGSFMYQHRSETLDDSSDPTFIVDLGSKEDLYSGELQHLYRSDYFSTVIGGGYFKIHADDTVNLDILIDPGPPPIRTQVNNPVTTDTKHTNLYLYSNVNYIKNVTVNVGGSADFLKSDEGDKNQWNPKFGITWNPLPNTTLRGAAFRVLKRTLITDQTLEPTQVAGFNQFYDDVNRTESWVYGGAADQKFSQSIYGGAEYTQRDMKVPFTSPFTLEETKVDWSEKLARAYLYWTPHKWLGLSAEYSYEHFHRDQFTLNVGDVKTNSVPLGITFHHPSGLSTMLKVTYYDQKGDFEPLSAPPGTFVSGQDNFWLFDLAISYRLPKRYGFITVGAKNLFDRQFNYFDMDPANPAIQPDRFVFARATLSID